MDRTKIILDCDPGHDDAIAIMLAAKNPAIDLIGITTVAGNHTLAHTLPNALHVVQELGLDVPVYGGMSLPMVRRQIVAAYIHGETGLDGPIWAPLTRKAQPEHAVRFIIDALLRGNGDITLVPTGPLTNIAMAMRTEPSILAKIPRIVLMGGAYGLGNTTPAAEFNILADPEAAAVVFSSGVPIVMMGLDLTNQTNCSMDIIERMERTGTVAGKLFGDIMRFTWKTQHDTFGLDGGPVHDVTTVAYLIDPSLFTLKEMYVLIDLSHGPCYGRTVCDYHGICGKAPNALVGITLDLSRFWDLVEETLRRYDGI